MPDPSILATSGYEPELLSLVDEEAGETVFFRTALDAFRQRTGVSSVALYHPAREGWNLDAASGSDSFPVCLQEMEEGYRTMELPGGRLVHTGTIVADRRALGPLLALLGSGLIICRLRRQLKQHRFKANYRGVELEALYDVGLAIASTLRLEDLCEEILLRAISLLDARRGAFYLLQGGTYRLAGTFGGKSVEGFTPVSTEATAVESWAASADLLPAASHLLAVAVQIEDRPLGLLVVADKESRRGVGPFAASDRRTLLLFANQASIALENARLHREALGKERLEHEMTLAAQIQERILPKTLPAIDGYEIHGWNRPAREVGGDYYQCFRSGDRLSLVAADVTGKGVPAALLVATLHSTLDLLLDRYEIGSELFDHLNRHILSSSTDNKFITLILVQLDPGSGTLDYISAGHDPGLLITRDGRISQLPASGLPLGLMAGITYRKDRTALEPGDLLCLYTDGFTECSSRADEEFGLERLAETVIQNRDRPLVELVELIDSRARSFTQGLPQADDQTLLLLRRKA